MQRDLFSVQWSFGAGICLPRTNLFRCHNQTQPALWQGVHKAHGDQRTLQAAELWLLRYDYAVRFARHNLARRTILHSATLSGSSEETI